MGTKQQEKHPVLVFVNNHFDPIWRRCWQRRFTFKGREYVSYAELEDYYITDNLAIAAANPEYKFEVESALVLRTYLERHPERLAELRQLAAEGRFTVPGAGENIIDSNMVLGESIVRNYLLGLLWVEETLGVKTRLAIRNDAFGNNAQLPQILRKLEKKWVTGLSYTVPKGKFWRGLDGSVICHAALPWVLLANNSRKHAPCPTCKGAGCPDCNHRGIPDGRNPVPATEIDEKTLTATGAGAIKVTPEELLPNPALLNWVKAQQSEYDIRFALEEEAYPFLQQWIEQVDNAPEALIHDKVELNPNSSGVWVSRIKTKQTCRRQEYQLLGLEALCALASWSRGATFAEPLRNIWRDLLFTMFHDAITATHVDPAYDELRDFWASIDAQTGRLRSQVLAHVMDADSESLSVFNPSGWENTQLVTVELDVTMPVSIAAEDGTVAPIVSARKCSSGKTQVQFVAMQVPPLAAKRYRLVGDYAKPMLTGQLQQVADTDAQPIIENERFTVKADQNGITEIFDKKLGLPISCAGNLRPNELVLERDEGSPWATTHPDRVRTPLAEYTQLVSINKNVGAQSMTFKGRTPDRIHGTQVMLHYETTVTLYKGLERVDFHTQIKWDTCNMRLRVALPNTRPGQPVYGIPFGMLSRNSYQPSFYHWASANGDWPAINWAGVESSHVSMALLNQGLPSYTVENEEHANQTMFLSLLRSPAMPTYLNEPEYYSMTDYDGMRDAGEHSFKYAVTAYAGPFASSTVMADAAGYNSEFISVQGELNALVALQVKSENVSLEALKWAEHGDGLVLRLLEFRGQRGKAIVTVPCGTRAVKRVNLLERDGTTIPIVNNAVTIDVRPWEIVTLLLEQ